MQKEINFSRYGKQFQESLAQLIMEDRPFADQMEEVLSVNFFERVKPIHFYTFSLRSKLALQ